MVMTYIVMWSPLYIAIVPLPRWLSLWKAFFWALGNRNLGHVYFITWKSMVSDISSMWMGKEKMIQWKFKIVGGNVDPGKWWDFQWHGLNSTRIRNVIFWVYLWCTCWHYPLMHDCKEMVRNKEIFSIYGLVPSRIQNHFLCFHLKIFSYWWKKMHWIIHDLKPYYSH